MTDEYQIDGKTHAEKDANGDIVHNPDVVNTGEIKDDNGNLYEDFTRIDKKTPSSSQSQIQFTGLQSNAEYAIWLVGAMGVSSAPSSFRLRINGDGSATGNYDYFDETGTTQNGENDYLIAELSNNARIASRISVTNPDLAATARQGISQDLQLVRPSRVKTFAREGGRSINESLTSVELIADDDFSGGDTLIELWERPY